MEPETSALLKTWLTPNGIAAFGIWAGIVVMTLVNVVRGRADRRRAVAEDNRHKEAMKAQADNHEEAMKAQADNHKEAMKAQADDHKEAMATQADNRRALEALIAGMETLIARTAPRPGPAG